MGNCADSKHGGAPAKAGTPHRHELLATGHVHVLICALDYGKTSFPLTCTVDGKNMADLARQSACTSLAILLDEAATISNVKKQVRQLGSSCTPGDCFVFYYAGHGTSLLDQNEHELKDEVDGKDEAYCFVDSDGQVSERSILRDDEFASLLTTCIPDHTKLLIISDCCHSGTIADFNRSAWKGRQAISISGCKDAETSGDTGRGGIFTHDMLLAIEKMNSSSYGSYSVRHLFKEALVADDEVFRSTQHLNIHKVDGTCDGCTAWPLVPPPSYRAPWHRGEKRRGARWFNGSPARCKAGQSPCDPVVHMLVCALDYKETSHPLTCSLDARNFIELAHACGVQDLVTLFDGQATKAKVKRAIRALGKRCKPDDVFLFFYAGHGAQLADQDGDEKDGQDECYCLVDSAGRVSATTCLRDDEFARVLTASVPQGVRILILSDCCHSGTVADFTRPQWRGHRAISMSGCEDKQTSRDTGKGGVFTHAMLMAVEKLSRYKSKHPVYSVGTLYFERRLRWTRACSEVRRT